MNYVLLACRMVVGLTFLVSLASKLRGRESWSRFAESTVRLLPGRTEARPGQRLGEQLGERLGEQLGEQLGERLGERRHVLAAAVTVMEGAVVGLTAVPDAAAAAFTVALAALVAFSFVIHAAIRDGRAIPCHCFGGRTSPVGPADLARNALLGLIALTGLALTVAGPVRGPDEPAGAAVAFLAALLVTVLVVLTGEIAELFGLTRESGWR
ncbi:MauE/DoxX family redox-associated membrane protein [Microbispora sp. NBC_01389]|uniref:MauE/DoxX family redox-associated membrane protein n=1 Tax=Microbispora sp. NBC_01389 TaxID=2903584 RepID=UPI00324DC777